MIRTLVSLGPAVALAALACGANSNGQPGQQATPAVDTARGIVRVTGAAPATRVVLRTPEGAIPLTGAAADTLRDVDGLEVWVAGQRTDAAIEVGSFIVRALDGVPAVNGRLTLDGDGVAITTAWGQVVRFTPAPEALRRLAGRNVWVAGRPGRAAEQWGVLR